MRRGLARRRSMPLAIRFQKAKRNFPKALMAAPERLSRLVLSGPMSSVFMTCMVTSGSGLGTVGTTTTRKCLLRRNRPARPGQQEIVVVLLFGAGPGTTVRGTSARPSATGTPQAFGASTSGFVWPERLSVECAASRLKVASDP